MDLSSATVSPRRRSKPPRLNEYAACRMCTPTEPSTWSASSPPPPFFGPIWCIWTPLSLCSFCSRASPCAIGRVHLFHICTPFSVIYTAARLPPAACVLHLNVSSFPYSDLNFTLDFLSTYWPVAHRHSHWHQPPYPTSSSTASPFYPPKLPATRAQSTQAILLSIYRFSHCANGALLRTLLPWLWRSLAFGIRQSL